MRDPDKKDTSTLTVVEAVETLSHIADLDFEQSIGIEAQESTIENQNPLDLHSFRLLSHNNSKITIGLVKDIFRVILSYLRNSYKSNSGAIESGNRIEGIKTIMVLVGEAARKLDRFTALFQGAQIQSVTDLHEYKKLQEFYLHKIDKNPNQQIGESILGKWILAISNKKEPAKKTELIGKSGGVSKHVYVDLESVKRDLEYELFFIRKEDGSRFFSPRLIRNIKLVNDFKGHFGEEKNDDPLLNVGLWYDKVTHDCAKNIIKATRKQIEKFYRETIKSKDRLLIEKMHNGFMALMLAANPRNLLHNEGSVKTCRHYFNDFLAFIRGSISSAEYQHLLAYPPSKANKLGAGILDVLNVICMAIYTQMNNFRDLLPYIQDLVRKSNEGALNVSQALGRLRLEEHLHLEYKSMAKLLKLHPNGPINKILDALESGDYIGFDPLVQGNFPSELFTLYVQDSKSLIARWPAPVHQDFINKASIVEEFKGFLRGCAHEYRMNKCLVFNFQDRATWREHFRSIAIEEMQNQESFSKFIDVVTIPKETEFYHQLSPYNHENHAESFMESFKEQLMDENCGFLFPENMKKILFRDFIDQAIHAIHRIFFSSKNVLQRENRLDFIEIFYFFLELKIIEIARPGVTAFSCKDGLDVTLSSSSILFVFLKLINQERLSEMDRDQLDLMLYGPSLLIRERLMIQERFNRMASAVKAIESAKELYGSIEFNKLVHEAFDHLYHTQILGAKCVIQGYVEEL